MTRQTLLLAILAFVLVGAHTQARAEEVLYSDMTPHPYDMAPTFVRGNLYRVWGTYFTGTEFVRLDNGQCGARLTRFVGWQSYHSLPMLQEDTDNPVGLDNILRIPELGVVFFPMPCENFDPTFMDQFKRQS